MTDYEYQEIEIKKVLSEMSSTFDNLHFHLEHYDEDHEDHEAEEAIAMLKANFEYYANRLRLLCITYFETKKQTRFLEILERAIEPFYKNEKTLRQGTMDDGDYVSSDLIHAFTKHLSIFPAFSNSDSEILKRTGLVYLEHILESTGVIIKQLKKKPKSEVEVYKAVRIVCEATFSNAQFLTWNFQTLINQPTFPVDEFFTDTFQQTVRCYKPDILIPTLNCAVEYKYADNEKTLIETIDQILIDVKGYDKHPKYRIFYAVFYVKVGIWSRKRFDEVWTEKNFPDNWKGRMVEGE